MAGEVGGETQGRFEFVARSETALTMTVRWFDENGVANEF
jgi:hypothetical protein